MKVISKNPNKDRIANYLAICNAFAEQQRQQGIPTEFLTKEKAPEVFSKLMKMSVALNDSFHPKHNEAVAFVKNSFPNATRDAIDAYAAIGQRVTEKVKDISEVLIKNGLTIDKAVDAAFNSLAGNPVYDHFGNLALLSAQLYEEQTFVNSFIDAGDAINMPIEKGGDGSSLSRFRSPSEQVTGSGKTYQGDLNSSGTVPNDSSRMKINLYNEFKDVKWLFGSLDLTSDERDQILMFENAVNPALAGFLIQQRLIDAAQKFLMKQAELCVVGGLDQRNEYIPNVGGSYGLLSSNILLALGDAADASPVPVSSAQWQANPAKLIQKITNYYYKPTTVAAPLPTNIDTKLMYSEILRLVNLAAIQNVDLSPREWVLFVPTTWYGIGMQYPSGGTFNKQLQEMVSTAVMSEAAGAIIKKLVVKTSSLMNYGANIGTGTNAYNFIILMAMGSPTEKKSVIMPGQTTIPTVIALPSSAALMSFQVRYATGGAMVKQYGGCYVLEFSNAA